MGLDMYALATRRNLAQEVDFEFDFEADEMTTVKFHGWRKHPDLHGWMERLYRDKGGAEDFFNCATVKLTIADLDRLEADIRGKRLPRTTGSFFGESDGSEAEDDLEFVREAREIIANNLTVFYTSSW